VHEAGEPNAVVDFLDAEPLAGQHGGDVDPLAMQAEAAASGDDDVPIVEASIVLPARLQAQRQVANDL